MKNHYDLFTLQEQSLRSLNGLEFTAVDKVYVRNLLAVNSQNFQ